MNPEAIAQKHNLRRSGHGWSGPCPKCGGSARSDKFQIRDDGGFKCYSCGFKGDAITWLREMEGMSCPEAFEALGQGCDRTSCAVRSSCRLGDGKAKGPRQARSASVPQPRQSRERTTEQRDPAEIWRQWAGELLRKGQETLYDHQDTLSWLDQQRGITMEAAQSAGLGYLDHPRNVDRASIGLPAERNGKTKLWVPAGLVIPTFDARGTLHRLRIRRTDADRKKFRADLKYVWIEGSGNAPMLIASREPAQGLVVVEAELDAIAVGNAHPAVYVLALGTVDMPPTTEQAELLRQVPAILVALDADAESAAGQKAVQGWLNIYRHAKYWPVPGGKDPGDYVAAGGDLSAWVTAGLPPRPVAAPETQSEKQDDRTIPLSVTTGGEGAEEECSLPHAVGATKNGHGYVIAYRAADVSALQRHYPSFCVFAPAEIKALKGMTPEQAEQMLLAKKIFDNGEIVETLPIDHQPVPLPEEPPRVESFQERLL